MPVALRALMAGACIALAPTLATVAHAAGPSKRECVEANEAAQDLQNAGHLLDARTKFRSCVNTSCPHAVREDCTQHLLDIEAAVPAVVLLVRDPAGRELTAVTVTVDGQPLTDPLGGHTIEVDPGAHQFTFTAEGEPPVTKTVIAREGEKHQLLDVVIGTPPPPPPKPVATPAPPPPDGATQRWIGVGLVGGGLVATSLGVVLALVSKSTYDHAMNGECGGDPHACSPQGAADGRTAQDLATGSTISFIAAGALVAGGSAVYFTAPNGARVAPSVGYRRAGLALEFSW
jgi:hypothetical protein